MKKVLLLLTGIALTVLMSGCSSGSTSKRCLSNQYKGIVVFNTNSEPSIYCSNGDLSPNGKNYLTSGGEKNINEYHYSEFKLAKDKRNDFQ